MIKKTIFAAIVLLSSYMAFIAWLAPRWWYASQHQWQDNIIAAQTFLYSKEGVENVIVGSSLAARLQIRNSPHIYNLSFSGQSIFDGLEIIRVAKTPVKRVFIEMNFVLRPENREFTQTLTSPYLFYLRENIPALREDKQPLAVVGKVVNILMKQQKARPAEITLVSPSNPKVTSSASGNGENLAMLELQIEDGYKIPNSRELENAFNNLTHSVALLKSRQVEVIFFEMPVADELTQLPKAITLRQTFYKHFNPRDYQYMPLPENFTVETNDGIHLVPKSASEYTRYFESAVQGMSR